jgi:hypothetical protein
MMTKEDVLHKLEEQVSKLRGLVDRAFDEELPIHEVERESFTVLMDAGLIVVTAHVARQGDGNEGKHLEHGGETLLRLEGQHKRCYRSIYGPIDISRYVYGTREGQEIRHVPLDARLGLPAEDISYVLEDWLERMCVKDAFRDSVDSLVALLGVRAKLSVDTAEEHSRQMAQHAASFRASQAMPPAHEEGPLLVATADGTTVPMRRSLDPKEQHRVPSRGSKGEGAQKYQMAYVGAIYTIDPFVRTPDEIIDELLRKQRAKDRPHPKHKHVWAEMTRPGDDPKKGLLTHGPTYLFAELAVECLARDPSKNKQLVCLLDGEKQLWEMQEDWLTRAVGILDIYHVMKRLRQAAECFHPEKSAEAKQFVERYLRTILQGRVGTVIRSFRKLLTTHHLTGEKLKRLTATITYYTNNRQHMRYNEYLAAGYPIGSGIAEGACGHVVKDRMACTGMRWSLEGAPSMLRLRALYLNGDWHDFVEHRIEREQAALYGQAA